MPAGFFNKAYAAMIIIRSRTQQQAMSASCYPHLTKEGQRKMRDHHEKIDKSYLEKLPIKPMTMEELMAALNG